MAKHRSQMFGHCKQYILIVCATIQYSFDFLPTYKALPKLTLSSLFTKSSQIFWLLWNLDGSMRKNDDQPTYTEGSYVPTGSDSASEHVEVECLGVHFHQSSFSQNWESRCTGIAQLNLFLIWVYGFTKWATSSAQPDVPPYCHNGSFSLNVLDPCVMGKISWPQKYKHFTCVFL